ncbi:MAG: prepilin-type N-terminal cleavage/methylation domain-containing protein [Lachnospiraceae bacterium]|nr:prepilin-type N-terminal cleavage/methylation domain-containing protein [Lachnospiraceae bacterium]
MMVEIKSKKLNNAGVSILEFIVVIAILAVVMASATIGLSLLTNSYAKKASSGLTDALSTVRTKAMSIAAKEWNLQISYEGETYKFTINKVVEVEQADGTLADETIVFEENYFDGDLVIWYYPNSSEANKFYLDDDDVLTFAFESGEGSVAKVLHNGVAMADTVGGFTVDKGKFVITRGNYSKSVELYFTTGKYEALD